VNRGPSSSNLSVETSVPSKIGVDRRVDRRFFAVDDVDCSVDAVFLVRNVRPAPFDVVSATVLGRDRREELSSHAAVRLGMTYRGEPIQLPILSDAASRAATPCSTLTDEPTRGTGRARYCWRCGLDVYDVASLAPADARAVMGLAGGAPCPALYVRRDGTVMKRDCPVGVRRNRVQRWLGVASAVVVLLAAISIPFARSHVRCGAAAGGVRDRYEFFVGPASGGAELVRVTRNAMCRDTSAGAR
jgi:hypothetical protein